jgi:UDP-N-acetylglucosamine 4,6-dehydratase/5-epimerase
MKLSKKKFTNSTIFITGGTGSFGQHFVRSILNYGFKKIIIYSRDEMKQWEMNNNFNNPKLQFIIGDVRDKERLMSSMHNAEIVIHAAATKIVPTSEENPEECIKTNIIGALNVIHCSIANNVKKIIALSTDKASSPINLYGATKLVSDKLFIAANKESKNKGSIFSVVRYGNVIGSRGSIIPFFLSLKKNSLYPITSFEMTRFIMSLDDGVDLVKLAISDSFGGEIFIKKSPSIKIKDIALSINKNAKFKVIGIRPGEKLHEQLISIDEAPYTYAFKDYYKILSPLIDKKILQKQKIKGKKVKNNFSYSSNLNSKFWSHEELRKFLIKNKLLQK